MKKAMTIFGVILFASAILTSCGKKASNYEGIVKEYKKVGCVVMDKNNNSMSDKSKALQRQQELNKEYEEALKNLSVDEQPKLMMSMANALAEISDGKCD
jgi:basic membrane lipoprotein Med (substrate-binding protein (PBP1-ABC) superfamily)